MPRTGSTSFQEMLTRLRPRLDEAGLCYPAIALPGPGPLNQVNHQPLAEALDGRRSRADRDRTLSDLSRVLAETQADTVVLSCEDFSLQKPVFGVPETLAALFRRHGFALEVAFVVKSQAEQLTSAYGLRMQVVHEQRSFRDFARAFRWSGRLDYAARLAPWREAAEGRAMVVPFRDRRSDQPLLARMLEGFGLADRLAPLLGPADLAYSTNRSPGPIAVEASRRLGTLRVRSQFQGHPRFIGHAIDEAAQARGLDAVPFCGDAADVLADMKDGLARRNDAFAAMVWGAPWDSVVASAPARQPNELAGRPIPAETEAQVRAVMQDVIARFGFRPPPPWWRQPLNRIEAVGERLALRLGQSRWRVV